MSTCLSRSGAGMGASPEHATGRFTAPFVIKDHLKAGAEIGQIPGPVGTEGDRPIRPGPNPLPTHHYPTTTNPSFLHAKSPGGRLAVTPLRGFGQNYVFCPAAESSERGVFYCRGLNDNRNRLGGKLLLLHLHDWQKKKSDIPIKPPPFTLPLGGYRSLAGG